jgi:hypothetical protein
VKYNIEKIVHSIQPSRVRTSLPKRINEIDCNNLLASPGAGVRKQKEFIHQKQEKLILVLFSIEWK